MAKFFDLNKNAGAEKEEPEKTEVKSEPKGLAEDAKKIEVTESKPNDTEEKVAPPIEHGSYTVPSEKDDQKEEPATVKSEKKDDDEPDKAPEDDAPKAPDIPRATASMAPEARSVSKPISSNQHLNSTSSKQKWVTVVLTLILLSLLGVLVWQAYIFYNSSQANKTASTSAATTTTPAVTKKTTTPEPTTTTSQAPATTTSTGLTKEKVTVKILNGNGVTGSASTASATVKTLGYTVSSTGNAKAFTYATSIVYYKTANAKDAADQLAAALTGYSVVAELNATVATTESELVFLVGKK